MKKFLALYLTMILCLCSLSSCGLSLKHKHISDEKWSFNENVHWKDITCTWKMCKFEIAIYSHLDKNGDHICDDCGYEIPAHEHSYAEWQYDEYKHWREYICECDLEAEMNTHTNDDGDALCDVCGYDVGIKSDYILYCQYYYTNEYGSHTHTQISLDGIDVSVLVDISNALSYIDGDPGSSPTKIKYCIRHYDTDIDPFFVTGDEQYLDLSENFTNERADVTYSIDYVNSQIIRAYTTPQGMVEGYAKLSIEQLTAIKEAFRRVADALEPKNVE